MAELTRFLDVAHRHTLDALKHIEIGKVGNTRYPDDCDVDLSDLLISVQALA